ncbi:MAG: heme oxygenase [Comamonadaceae bacterium]|nr:MAG: heme oxygenase [Comamonadaceae bacterium]
MAPHTSEALSPSRSADLATDPLAALRDATREQHARLDAGLPIAQPLATLNDYAAHAAALSAWLAALAPELQALAAREPRFAPDTAARLQALRADLRDAGASPAQAHGGRGGPSDTSDTSDTSDLDDHSEHDPVPSIATRQQMQHALAQAPDDANAVRWGFAYVVEGSQLGGQVMHRQLAPRLAPHPLRYLQGRGADTGGHWKSFLALLRSHLATPQATAAACIGAQAAFAGLAQHLHAEGAKT